MPIRRIEEKRDMGAIQIELGQWQSGDALAAVLAYVLGCANAAYYLVRWRTGQDIRGHGSGNAGARNAGRLLGARAFALAFVLDAAKGLGAVLLAVVLGAAPLTPALCALLAVAGHVWPAQLHWRGGKGVATSMGALIALAASAAAGLAAVGAILAALLLFTHRHNLGRRWAAARLRVRSRRALPRHPT
jgi:glycerol-3-phosphate acyltransferase PlsY